MKRELERIEVPEEHDARERSWAVISAAFAEREPQPRQRSWKPAVAIALTLVVMTGLLSPPGRAVLDELREVVGVEESAPALFSLPASGSLLVSADSGIWVVAEDGSKRLLGAYREASWSPFGRFVIAAKQNELVALEPDGDVRWTLARRNVRFPRWTGSRTDTRIAYLSQGGLRVVAGNGKNDRLLDRGAASGAPAWRPGPGHVLVYARKDGTVRAIDVDTRAALPATIADRRLLEQAEPAALQRLLGEAANLETPVRSPDGRWLAAGWPDADQLVFVRTGQRGQIRAVSNVSAQFRSRSFPRIEGWCCAP